MMYIEIGEKKFSINKQVNEIHNTLNINKTTIKKILDSYTNLAYDELINNRNFRFGNIAMIYSNKNNTNDTPITLAYIAYKISEEQVIPENTVLGVLTCLIELVEIHLRNGDQFILRGLFALKPVLDANDKVVNIHSTLSKHLYSTLKQLKYDFDVSLRTRVLTNFRDLL